MATVHLIDMGFISGLSAVLIEVNTYQALSTINILRTFIETIGLDIDPQESELATLACTELSDCLDVAERVIVEGSFKDA